MIVEIVAGVIHVLAGLCALSVLGLYGAIAHKLFSGKHPHRSEVSS